MVDSATTHTWHLRLATSLDDRTGTNRTGRGSSFRGLSRRRSGSSGASAPQTPAHRSFDPDPEQEDQQEQQRGEADDTDPGGERNRHQGEYERDQEVGEQRAAGGGAGGDVAGQAHHFRPGRR